MQGDRMRLIRIYMCNFQREVQTFLPFNINTIILGILHYIAFPVLKTKRCMDLFLILFLLPNLDLYAVLTFLMFYLFKGIHFLGVYEYNENFNFHTSYHSINFPFNSNS
ncbi:hypothetical protein ACH5RR_041827 [Cinchona calisaya]|uniref:Uncharacterized protein n=1 Tax=Cinchona calisaya TaxID=153742 RepID=A0ABD2XYN5_9GENT